MILMFLRRFQLLVIVAACCLTAPLHAAPAEVKDGWFSPPDQAVAELPQRPAQPIAVDNAGQAPASAPVTAAATTEANATPSTGSVASKYRLGSGDKVRIIVFGEENLSGEYEIDGTGKLSLQLVGDIDAAGLSVTDVKEIIEERLRNGYLLKPSVAVEVLNYRPFYVLGEVNQPGSYPFVSGMTVLKAIAIAGGYTPRARKNRVELIRNSDPTKMGMATTDAPVYPGDVIKVQERLF